jgi:Ca2+-binding EF-hand superfamily protein
MRYGFLALVLFFSLPLQAGITSAFPIKEADYLKEGAARFTAADANRDGALSADELRGAFSEKDAIYLSEETKTLCVKMGHDMQADYTPPVETADKAEKAEKPHPMMRKDYDAMRLHMFQRFDQDRDHTITEAEAVKADRHLRSMCQSMPQYMKQVNEMQKDWQSIKGHPGGMDIEQLKKQQGEMMKTLEKMRTAPPPQGTPE